MGAVNVILGLVVAAATFVCFGVSARLNLMSLLGVEAGVETFSEI